MPASRRATGYGATLAIAVPCKGGAAPAPKDRAGVLVEERSTHTRRLLCLELYCILGSQFCASLVEFVFCFLTCKDCECSQACCLLKLFGLDVQQG